MPKPSAARKCISAEETSLFCSQVAMLLKSGILLHDGIGTLCNTYQNTRYGHVFEQLESDVKETGALCDALERAGCFPSYMVHMVRIGEKAGVLEDVMNSLSAYYEREARTRAGIRSAVMYPLILTVVMTIVIAVLSVNVMPLFSQVFDNLGADMSQSAAAVMRFGTVTGRVVLYVVAALLVLLAVVGVLLKTALRQEILTLLYRLLPPVRRINESLSAARFSSVMSKLLESGYPLEEAVALVPDILPDPTLRQKLAVCRADMASGMPFAQAVEKTHMYGDIHIKMLRVGTQAGQTDTVMEKLADIYDEQAEAGLRRLVSVAEPLMVAVLCLVIGAILLSVMLPLASIMSSIT